MMASLNGVERTAMEYRELLRLAGWELKLVFHNNGMEVENAKMTAVPI